MDKVKEVEGASKTEKAKKVEKVGKVNRVWKVGETKKAEAEEVLVHVNGSNFKTTSKIQLKLSIKK